MTESTPWTRLVARAMKDKAFRTRLLADPMATLKEAGVALPEGMTVRVVENTAKVVHMVLPASVDDQLSDAELERIAAGIYPIARTAICTEDCGGTRG
jgi:hypothetical protein